MQHADEEQQRDGSVNGLHDDRRHAVRIALVIKAGNDDTNYINHAQKRTRGPYAPPGLVLYISIGHDYMNPCACTYSCTRVTRCRFLTLIAAQRRELIVMTCVWPSFHMDIRKILASIQMVKKWQNMINNTWRITQLCTT